MTFLRMFFLILLQFFNLHNVSASSWQTLSGKPPVVIARGGFSGVFPDSSSKAYEFVSVTTSLNLALWCDLQLTKDGVGICFPNQNLYNYSDVKDVYPNKKEWFSVDFTWKDLSDVNLVQNVKSRSGVFDGSYQILTVEIVAELGPPGLWLNIQNSAFYRQHNLSMRNYVVSLSKRVDFISSPEISFLKSMKKDVTKLIFRFLNQDQIEPFTDQTYSSLSKNLSYIKTFSSGILVPKSYIWPLGSDLYLKPHTSLVTEAHRQGLQVFALEFANDFVFVYNYSYDPTAEYLSFIDNGNFSVDGFLSDFPVTPYRAISCFSHLDTKEDEEPAVVTIISKDGASGDFPGCTDLAYEKAVKDGVDILDCNVQMSKDKIPFCMSSIDLLNTTNVFDTSFRNLSSTVAEIQPKSGIYTFSLTMSQIKTLKPVISNPKEDHALFRNPRNKNVGKFLTLSEFLFLANRYNSLLGVLIKVENAVYLAKHQGISVVDAVLNKTERLSTQEGQTTSIAIMFQSTDKSVLMDFKEKKLIYPDELVYRVDEDIRDVTDSAIKEIMSFAGTIIISKESVLP
ncbi:glycerophosphodiester phosphodiesterase GDPDL5-like [Brassica napus]|uniref:glycerophosphodiester phosphodiesterase GDPDL5-like n=1 Tax=Brassica napus TaxID=3708 RepID=UPI002078B253|nr:glycerophosphodiester phosphodiesterase GDPDL5-like [Brassica napus]